ncbi:MAG: radical SAM protein [Dictyoglomus sp.]|nr:radical SAM protein [Dictyoglomus sp.]MCX7941616.1 radical SAM protein [Dictyoglomaceae bacterium]MDW8187765.1 radical SAM protein [Dictyoglomus sp.]
MGITIVKPINTLPLSITGEKCVLRCNHCKGHYLKGMIALSKVERKIQKNNYKSILISGGFDLNGKLENISKDILESLKKKGFKLNCHLGLIGEEDIKDIMGLIDEISFDLILDEAVIQKVFHLKKTPEDFKDTFKLLKNHFSVNPHIVVGLNCGKIEKEYEAIDFLSKFQPLNIIFIIFTPIKNTPMEHISPPSINMLKKFFLYTKEKIPKANLYLGCVRPSSDYREKTDFLAYELGFKAIVNPHPKVLEYLKKSDLIENYFYECCAFLK